jgi:hypothetical protein
MADQARADSPPSQDGTAAMSQRETKSRRPHDLRADLRSARWLLLLPFTNGSPPRNVTRTRR